MKPILTQKLLFNWIVIFQFKLSFFTNYKISTTLVQRIFFSNTFWVNNFVLFDDSYLFSDLKLPTFLRKECLSLPNLILSEVQSFRVFNFLPLGCFCSLMHWMRKKPKPGVFFTGDFYLTGLNSAVNIAPQEAQLGPAAMALCQGQFPNPFCWRFRRRTAISTSELQNKLNLKLHNLAERIQLGKAVFVLAIPLTSSPELIT